MTDWNFFIRMIYKEVGVHSIFVLLKPFLFSVTALLQLFCVFLFYTSTNISGVRLTVWAHHFTGEITSCKLKFYAIFFISLISRLWNSSKFCCPGNHILQNLYTASIIVICLHESWAFNVLPDLKVFLSPSITPIIPPCLCYAINSHKFLKYAIQFQPCIS